VSPSGEVSGIERSRTVRLGGIDPRAALGAFSPFRSDPACRWWPDAFARAVHTPSGPGTIRFRWQPSGEVTVTAWGSPDAVDRLLGAAPRWLGRHDERAGWDPRAHPRVAELDRRHPGLRLGASGLVWAELVPVVLGQRVTTEDAARAWQRLVTAWGCAAPGPAELGLRLGPAPGQLAARGYAELHRFDVERRRADALLPAAQRADRLEEAAELAPVDALGRLSAVPGLGPWTATSTVAASHGDPDVVVLGDFWMPTLLSYALTGERQRVGDDRMLELLAPFAGHRWRVCRLVLADGVRRARRAPRPAFHRIAHL
jgi:3-methyladenine DNA glycosylase/8-oxoguanine DNA glycosylase